MSRRRLEFKSCLQAVHVYKDSENSQALVAYLSLPCSLSSLEV